MTSSLQFECDITRVDCVVIGAGPAGLQLGCHLTAAGCEYVILDSAAEVGSFFTRYPRSRRLISFNKRHSIFDDTETNLRWDWNSLLTDDGVMPFPPYSDRLYPHADEMVRYLHDYAAEHALPIRLNDPVQTVSADGRNYLVRTSAGYSFSCGYVLVATGLSEPHLPDIPGIEHAESYDSANVDPESFEDARVLIIGKGNSAIEVCDEAVESAALVHMASPSAVRLAYKTRHPGSLRVHRSRMFDLYQLKMLHSLLDCTIESIEPDDSGYRVVVSYSHADGEWDELHYDRVVRCTGFRFDSSIFAESAMPRFTENERLPETTACWESTANPGVFFAGTLMQSRDLRGAGSAFIDGFRYNIRTLHRLLQERYHDEPYPSELLPASASGLAEALCRRASTTSALWVQFGILCDCIIPRYSSATWYRELPMQDVPNRFADTTSFWTLSFQWGQWTGDPFAIDRHPNADDAERSVFLHPVVRHWSFGEVTQEHHLLEDLVGTYHPDVRQDVVRAHSGVPVADYHRGQHLDPLSSFLATTGATLLT